MLLQRLKRAGREREGERREERRGGERRGGERGWRRGQGGGTRAAPDLRAALGSSAARHLASRLSARLSSARAPPLPHARVRAPLPPPSGEGALLNN